MIFLWYLIEATFFFVDVAYSPNNTHVAITGVDGQLRIIDYKNER